MDQITPSNTHELADLNAFCNLVNDLEHHSMPVLRNLFDAGRELLVTRAPGRLDVMGGIADYSGSLVLQLPIRESACVAVQRQTSRHLRIVTLVNDAPDRQTVFDMNLADFEAGGGPVPYAAAQALFARCPATHWAAYAAGVFLVLMSEQHARFAQGANVLIRSDVPEGKGVSSSAALEVAVMRAVSAAYRIPIAPRELALLCQMVENLVVGAPCGVMDQMTSACGQSGQLLALLCQPAELEAPVAIPEEIEFWGIDSGVRHSVSGADYGSVRVGAFMGYRIIADMAGLETTAGASPDDPVRIADNRWNGHLANIEPVEFESHFAAALPERITGRLFLERYQNTTDPVTSVQPDREYAVRTPTAHPIYEHRRVRAYRELLQQPYHEQNARQLGQLMFESHASYAACGLTETGTDRLVELVRETGPVGGLYGAKITGGGSGGTVAVLARRGSEPALRTVVRRYAKETGYESCVFSGSSPGACAVEPVRLHPST